MHTVNNGTFVSVLRKQRFRAIEVRLSDVHALWKYLHIFMPAAHVLKCFVQF